jgi:hypothetical protein
VRGKTVQLVHDGADVFHPFRDFQAHGFLDAHTKRVAVLVRGKVIQTVCQSQRLRVGEAFTQFLDAPMDVPAVDIHLFHDLSFQ